MTDDEKILKVLTKETISGHLKWALDGFVWGTKRKKLFVFLKKRKLTISGVLIEGDTSKLVEAIVRSFK